ncbi:MAG: urea carboxylase-associated family protein [Desulfuromonadaceae bacterium]|nr:urea carboxylase-associated family protein [Desulfuromonadaceae bacterium]
MSLDSHLIRFEELLPGGWNFSHILKRGTALRLTDLEGGANVSALFYNAANVHERYNMSDTLKAQFISRISLGTVCYSDMGRVLVSVIGDSCGWHDTISGVSNAATNLRKYGERNYQEARNGYYRNGYDSLLAELAKYGMGKRDMTATVNFFTRIAADDEGNLAYVDNNSSAGSHVDLQAEMDTLVILCSCPHPMDPKAEYAPGPVKLTIWDSGITPENNPCRGFCPQNERGFINTGRYHL